MAARWKLFTLTLQYCKKFYLAVDTDCKNRMKSFEMKKGFLTQSFIVMISNAEKTRVNFYDSNNTWMNVLHKTHIRFVTLTFKIRLPFNIFYGNDFEIGFWTRYLP